jgi:two-component system, OmpR family, alkaline phosphatase synthesis response regulator PhoP
MEHDMEKKRHVYIIEDEEEIAEIIAKFLNKEGYEVTSFNRGDSALKELLENPPDIAILDIMLPGVDGIEILKQIRATHCFPVIFISARREEVDRILGIELGADDYMPKPFSFRELVARVKSIFRRIDFDTVGQSAVEKSLIKSKSLVIDLDSMTLHSKESSVELTATEFSILKVMMSRPGRIFTRGELQYYLAEGDRATDTRAIDIHIMNMRRKIQDLGASSMLIQSIRGVGYKYED